MKHTLLFTLASLSCLGMGAQNKEAIRLNQVGHFPHQEKYVVVDGQHTTAELTVTDNQGRIVARKAPERTAVSPWSGKKRTLYNLSERQNTGMFTVKVRSEEHTSELQSRQYLVCRLLLEKKKQT